ncbi:hemerythrin domain-containing protein [Gloeocapsa sp. PCC 73106]|uniref:hemerythrin domain-containing protein n=1 Tax=Gloeocapsa sp. PCC 73106 TaxID=102232 RepID=UPI0002ABCE24|nr:hemerythrin domain-containing protein [Gloeocapsa sp. PCC 73106]ELR98484.1 hypothetical protein GLO73106DRAFT_00023170 [Gloeocapsa sp. PCC 73106]
MVTTQTDSKRSAIAEKLADVRAFQNLIIANEEMLISKFEDPELHDRLQKMLEDDQKNLGVVETVITAYGIQAKPKEKVVEAVQQYQKLMQDPELTLYEKVAQLELLKHTQVISGLIIHKAAQVVGKDIAQAIVPLNTVNFENRAHQEQLKGFLEVLGTRELTGQDADSSVWAGVQDALAALSGIVGSVVTQSSDQSDLKIQDVLRIDHQKVNTLFSEILKSDDMQKNREFFGQLAQDLSVHSEAEEQVVYPKVRQFYDDTQELYDQQSEAKVLLKEIETLAVGSDQFKLKLKELQDAIDAHVRQEEGKLFAAIRNNFSVEQQQQLATEFKEAKKQLQTKLA